MGTRLGTGLGTALAAVEPPLLQGLTALPDRAKRLLAGAPVVVDGQTLDLDTQLLLRVMRVARKPVVEQIPVPEGRVALRAQSAVVGGTQPIGAVRELEVAGLPARLYVPRGVVDPGPLLLFFHGGGFVWGDLESHDASCRFLAEQAQVRVLAVDYRLAPEHPFPAAADDAEAALRWVTENPGAVDADPARIAVGGDSAGGNLAIVAAMAAARHGWPLKFQLLVYPAVDQTRDTRSLALFREGFFLSARFMEVATASYSPPGTDLRDPRLSPAFADLAEIGDTLAPAYVATAGFDPLRDEGEEFSRALAEAGVEVRLQRFPDLIHSFFNMLAAGRAARAANREIAHALRVGLHGS